MTDLLSVLKDASIAPTLHFPSVLKAMVTSLLDAISLAEPG